MSRTNRPETSMSAAASRPLMRATPAIRTTVAARTAQAMLEALRLRVEAEPGSGQTFALNKVEQHILHGRLPQAGEDMERITQALNERAEAARVGMRLDETIGLNAARGEEQEGRGSGEVRVLNRDGLLWLKQKKRLTGSALLAAERYRKLFSLAKASEVATSRYGQAGGAARTSGFTPSQPQTDAIIELGELHRDTLARDANLIRLVEAVCGRGETLMDLAGGDKHVAVRLETELNVACRLLARRFGIG